MKGNNNNVNIAQNQNQIQESDLIDIFSINYNDLFSKILKKDLNSILTMLKKQVIYHLQTIRKSSTKSLFSSIFEKFKKKFKEEKEIIENFYIELSKRPKTNILYLTIFDIYIHCFMCKEARHKCGKELINYNGFFFCLKCKKVYNKNHIKLYCYHCHTNYLTTKRDTNIIQKFKFFYPVVFNKYHCSIRTEEKIKCFKCGDDLYYDIRNGNKYISNSDMDNIICIKCKLRYDTKETNFICKICGQSFMGQPKLYRNFSANKKYYLLLVHAFRKGGKK